MLPPYAQLLNLRIEDGDHGPMVVMPFDEDVVGRPGFLHGGAIAGLLEFAAFTTLGRELGDEQVAMKPITVTVDYMRGGTDRDTFATATIERLGNADRQCRSVRLAEGPVEPNRQRPDQRPAQPAGSVAAEFSPPGCGGSRRRRIARRARPRASVEADVMLVGHADATVHLDALAHGE